MSGEPVLSVVSLTDGTFETCRRSITSFLNQTVRDRIEIVLVGTSREEIAPDCDLLDQFHSYRIVELGEVHSTGQGLAAGVFDATAPLVTYLEEHSFMPTDYAETVVREMDEKKLNALGYGMTPANPGTVAWAHIFLQFATAVAPVASGVVDRLGGHHAAYRRDMLVSYGDLLPHLMGNEAVLHEDLRHRGIPMVINGDIVVEHAQISDLWHLMRHEFLSQRAFADARMNVLEWPMWKRLVYTGGSPLIPFLRLGRAAWHIGRSGRWTDVGPLGFLTMFAAGISGAAGEATGYLFGARTDVMRERMAYELNRYAYVNRVDRANAPRSEPLAEPRDEVARSS